MTLVNPAQLRADAEHLVARLETIAGNLKEEHSHYSREGLEMAWERRTIGERRAYDALKTRLDDAEEGISKTIERHYEELVPLDYGRDEEIRFRRIINRLEWANNSELEALEVWKQELGNPFACLWEQEMLQRAIFRKEERDLNLSTISPEFEATINNMQAATSVVNNVLKRALAVVEERLDYQYLADRIAGRADLDPFYYISHVEAIVEPGFTWSTTGRARKWETKGAK